MTNFINFRSSSKSILKFDLGYDWLYPYNQITALIEKQTTHLLNNNQTRDALYVKACISFGSDQQQPESCSDYMYS